jgi:hypothetical protein
MSDHRARRIDRHTAEQLLRGVPGAPSAAPDRLTAVLAAATAPARPGELSGEEAALAAFRQAKLAPAARPRHRSTLARVVSVKVAALSLAVTGLGGIAVAAGSGALPNPLDRKPPVASPSPSRIAAAGPGATETQRAVPAEPRRHGTPSAGPSPSMLGLCRAYRARPARERGKALETPAFAALVAAAGGDGKKVDRYCDGLLDGPAGRPPRPGKKKADEPPKPTVSTEPGVETPARVDRSIADPARRLTG